MFTKMLSLRIVWKAHMEVMHGYNTDTLAMAVGEQNSTWTDYGMSWDNSGKNGHYASINWSNA